ncbi:MAG: acetoacetate decarboxylase [Pseudonocardiales bacterium]|nr:MAG: acetoacetate decarboxylase [Pseudonocardiales bacterium]
MLGFSVPRSPQGRAALTPPPPWFYAGNLLLVDYGADPEAVAAVLPPGLTPDPDDPGGAVAFFVDWQYASTSGHERTDPVLSQYHEFFVLVNAVHDRVKVQTCPYIYVDRDTSMARGWIQGWPKKLGQVHTTRPFPLPSPAAPQVAPGGQFGASLSANGRRLAEATLNLERVSADPVFLGRRPIINVRYFPRLTAGQHNQPAVHELVKSLLSGATRTDIWEGPATLAYFPAPDAELDALAPRHVRRGYRYSTAFQVDDLHVLTDLTGQQPQ